MANISGKRYAQSSSTLNSHSLTSLATISSQRARCSSYLSGLAMKPHLEVTSSQRSAQKHAVALRFRNVRSNCEDSQIRFIGSSLLLRVSCSSPNSMGIQHTQPKKSPNGLGEIFPRYVASTITRFEHVTSFYRVISRKKFSNIAHTHTHYQS